MIFKCVDQSRSGRVQTNLSAMKQQVLCCLLLTISAGTSHAYGVKSSFSKSYSNSAASASSSAFSNSYSSGEDLDLNDINNSLKAGSSAISSAFANAGANGASSKAGSGAYTGSGSYASSGSFSGSGGQIGNGNLGPQGHSGGSGSYSGSGSFSDSGDQLENGINLGPQGHSGGSGSYSGSGSFSGSGGQIGTGPNLGPRIHSGGSGSHSGLGSYSSSGSLSGSGISSGSGDNSGSGSGLDINTGTESNIGGSYITKEKISEDNPSTGPVLDVGSGVEITKPNPGSVPINGKGSLPGSGSYSGSGSTGGHSPGSIPVSVSVSNPNHNKPGIGGNTKLGPVPGAKHNVNIPSIPPRNVFINDFQVPDEYAPTVSFTFKPRFDDTKSGSNTNSNAGSDSGYNQGSLSKSKQPCCQGPFPGPKGSIHDFKPAPSGAESPPAWIPDNQKPSIPVHSNPSYINSENVGTNNGLINTGTTGLSPGLIHSFPGSTGSIYDSKPAPSDSKPINPGDNIPVAVIPVAVGGPPYHQKPDENPAPGSGAFAVIGKLPGPTGNIYTSVPVGQTTYQQKEQPTFGQVPIQPNPNIYNKKPDEKPAPGSGAFAVIGKLPGPTGNIHTSVQVGQDTYQQKEQTTFGQVPDQPNVNIYNKNPVPSPDLINSFPGKPGNIHDSKPVPGQQCAGRQCQPNKPDLVIHQQTAGTIGIDVRNNIPDVYTPGPSKPTYPDCSTGQCDQYGGRLGCYGNDCFGPGKKPSNVYSGSSAGSNANSNGNHESGAIDINVSKPTPGTHPGALCTNGKCSGTPGNINCPDGKCKGVNVQQPGQGIIAVEVTPIRDSNDNTPNLEVYPIPGSTNFDINQPVPEYPGTLCSGIQCLLSPISGSKHLPGSDNGPINSGCSGAYCISIIPEPQGKPSCSGGNCGNVPNNKARPICVGGNCGIIPNNKEKPDKPNNGYQQTGSSSNANAHSAQGHEKIDVHNNGNQPNNKIPTDDLPIEVDISVSPEDNKEPIPTESPTPSPKLEDKKPGASMDFLLPGNKPYHPHHPQNIKPQQPTKPSQESHSKKDSVEGYYSCTGSSCPLPKHPGQVSGNTNLPHPTPNNPGNKPGQPNSKPDCAGKHCGEPTPYPGQPDSQPSCGGKPCKVPQSPENHRDSIDQHECTGGPCRYDKLAPSQVPDWYKGAGNHDRLYVPEYAQKEVSPLVIPVLVGGEPQPEPYGNKPSNHYHGSGSTTHTGADAQDGFVSGSVVVEKPNGILIPVIDVRIPGHNKPGYSCSGGKCDGPRYTAGSGPISGADSYNPNKPGYSCSGGKCDGPRYPTGSGPISGADAGSYSGSSNLNLHGNHNGPFLDRNAGSSDGSIHGNDCADGKCGSNGGLSGTYAGSSSGNFQSNVHGTGCSNGRCGAGVNGGQSGSHSGSASYGGVKGGCKTADCGFPSSNGGAQSGSFASSSSYSGSNSGAYHGGSGGGGSASFSSAGSNAGLEDGFPLLKELITKSIKGDDFHSGLGFPGAGSFSRSGSYSGGGGSSHSSAYSGSGSFFVK